MFHRSRFTQIISLMLVRKSSKSRRIKQLISECFAPDQLDCTQSKTLQSFLNGGMPRNTNMNLAASPKRSASHDVMATVYAFPEQ